MLSHILKTVFFRGTPQPKSYPSDCRDAIKSTHRRLPWYSRRRRAGSTISSSCRIRLFASHLLNLGGRRMPLRQERPASGELWWVQGVHIPRMVISEWWQYWRPLDKTRERRRSNYISKLLMLLANSMHSRKMVISSQFDPETQYYISQRLYSGRWNMVLRFLDIKSWSKSFENGKS